MKLYKKIISYIIFSVIFYSTSFSAGLTDLLKKKEEEFIPVQTKYDALSEVVPTYIVLQPSGTSMITQEVLDSLQNKLNRAMIDTEKMKPVTLDKWLISQYGIKKAQDSNKFINTLSSEKYPCLMKGACHLYIFKTSEGYGLILSISNFERGTNPITTFRKIEKISDSTNAFLGMLNEYQNIIENNIQTKTKKKKIVMKPFVLESRKYVGQSDGEFEYIQTPFIEQDGVSIRSSDDFFSRLLGYSLYTTQMVEPIIPLDLEQYAEIGNDNLIANADFYIEGRIQLTDQINIYHISLFDAKTKRMLKDVKFFSSDFSITGIWKANNNIVFSLADYIFGKDNYGISPDINVPGQGMFLNNIYIGCDNLEKCVLPKGKHIIYTGDYYKPDANVEIKNKNKSVDIDGELYRSFFLYLDERNWLFRGKDGERVWNLLEK